MIPTVTVNCREKFPPIASDVLHVTHTRAAVFRWENYPIRPEACPVSLIVVRGKFRRPSSHFMTFGANLPRSAKLAQPSSFKCSCSSFNWEVQKVISSLLDRDRLWHCQTFRSLASPRDHNRWKMPVHRSEFSGRIAARRGDGAKIGAPQLRQFKPWARPQSTKWPRTDRLAWGSGLQMTGNLAINGLSREAVFEKPGESAQIKEQL